MDAITTGVIASSVYDILKNGLKLSAKTLRERLSKWVKEDIVAEAVATEISRLGINDEMSESAIKRNLDKSDAIAKLVSEINSNLIVSASSSVDYMTQNHSGSGDNVAGNKIVR